MRFELPDLHAHFALEDGPHAAVEGYARKGLNMYGGILALDTASNVISGAGLNEEINYGEFQAVRRISPACAGCPWKQNTAKVVCDVALPGQLAL